MTRALIAAATAALLLLAGCATGPTQPERVAATRVVWEFTRATALDAETRIREVVAPTRPDLTFTAAEINSHNGGWFPCHDELVDNAWDAPKDASWTYTIGYDIEPRQGTIDLIEPLVQSYAAEGWTLYRDNRDDASGAGVKMAKDGWVLLIDAASQAYVDKAEDRRSYLRVAAISPCVPAPDNLSEWDPERPDDYSFVTESPPEPTW